MNGIETSSQEKDMIQKFKESEERLKKQNQILLRLAKSSAIDNGDLQAALKEITIAATEALNCDRSSVWIYNPEKTAIVCLNLFENSKNAHASGVELFAKDFPAYFKYLQEERSLAAHNAHTDPSTYEFSVVYLTPLGINSMLDAPFRLEGSMVGVICNEHVGPQRVWTLEEQNFAGSLADLISRAMQAEKRQSAQNELKRINENLENIVEERTRALQKANSELSEAMENLKKTQKKLLESEKMASLGGLVAGVAHEINTPVGIGVTAASHLTNKTKSFQEIYKAGKMKKSDLDGFLDTVAQSGEMILSNLDRAANLIQSFKQVAVDQSIEDKREIELKNYIEEVLMSLRPKLKQSNHSVTINSDESVSLNTFPGTISQVVTNLVMNSVIHGFEERADGIISIDIKKLPNNHVSLVFKDNGRGIEKENLSKIFDPFFTTKRGSGGSGLGLNIIYNLISQKLNGTITCESEIGKGVNFLIEIPLVTKD